MQITMIGLPLVKAIPWTFYQHKMYLGLNKLNSTLGGFPLMEVPNLFEMC